MNPNNPMPSNLFTNAPQQSGVPVMPQQGGQMGAEATTFQALQHINAMPANTPYLQQLKQWMLHSFAFAHGGTDVDPGAIPMHPALGAAPAGAPTAQKVQPTKGASGGMSTTRGQMMVRPNGSSVNDTPNTSTQFGPTFNTVGGIKS